MSLYELNKKLKIARGNAFIFNQINKLTIKISSSLSNVNILYYLMFQIPMCHRQFFRIVSHNPEYVKTHCNDKDNPFKFAIRQWMIRQ